MFQLTKKMLLFLVILALIKLSLDLFYKDELTHRREKLSEQDYNTVFIGSSRTKFAINAHYFDLLTNNRTKSYNFAIAAGLPPRTLDWGEEIINSNPSVKHIFIEISGVDSSQFELLRSARLILQDYQHETKDISLKKLSDYSDRIVMLLFKPLWQTEQANFDLTLGSAVEKNDLKSRREIPQKGLNLTKLRGLQVENNDVASTENEEYRREIENLLKAAESKNIKVYFFVPPRLETDNEVNTVSPIYHKIAEKYKIRAAHLDESLYTVETSHDLFHLNQTGAEIFTKKIAELFIEKSF